MKTLKLITVACVCASMLFVSCDKDDDNNTDSNQLNSTDRTFTTQASIANTAEIGAANLALAKATNVQVRNYAQAMITEHTMAQNDLKSLGTAVGITITDSIDPAHVTLMTQLNGLSGRAFDSVYIYSQANDHRAVVTQFQTEISNGNHQSVKGYANTYLPHIQMHLTSADSIALNIFPR